MLRETKIWKQVYRFELKNLRKYHGYRYQSQRVPKRALAEITPWLDEKISVSDPHTLNADPDPGLWLNTDPGSGSRIPNQDPESQYQILIKSKKFSTAVFSRIL